MLVVVMAEMVLVVVICKDNIAVDVQVVYITNIFLDRPWWIR